MKRTTKSIITFILALAMLISIVPANAFAAAKTYHAYLAIQTDTSWVFRDSYDNAKTGHTSKYFHQLNMSQKDGTIKKMAGTFKDATIKKNGTYTVTLTNPDFNGDTHLSGLYLSTDIPVTKKVKITDVKAKFDGSTKQTYATGTQNKDSKKYVQILLLNNWNPQFKDAFAYPMPFKKLEISFTIKGL